MGEIIGRMTCPVCGAQHQNLKINKNGNLYMYCDNRCSARFNPKESREIIDELRQGRTVRKGNAIYVPLGVPAAKVEKPVKQEVKANDGQQRGNRIDGRTNGHSSGDAVQQQRPAERFAAWLWGDDEL